MSFPAAEQVVIAGGTHIGIASGGRAVINNWGTASAPQQISAGNGKRLALIHDQLRLTPYLQ